LIGSIIGLPGRSTAAPGETAKTEPKQRDHHHQCIAKKAGTSWQNATGYSKRSRTLNRMLELKHPIPVRVA
jgi:hypothetical protein